MAHINSIYQLVQLEPKVYGQNYFTKQHRLVFLLFKIRLPKDFWPQLYLFSDVMFLFSIILYILILYKYNIIYKYKNIIVNLHIYSA